jgi:hypothetical protein
MEQNSPQINSNIYVQLILYKEAKNKQRKRAVFSIEGFGKTVISYTKE